MLVEAGNAAVKTEFLGSKRPVKRGLGDRHLVPPRVSVLQSGRAASRWPRWPLGLWRCRLKTPSAGRSPSGTGFPP